MCGNGGDIISKHEVLLDIVRVVSMIHLHLLVVHLFSLCYLLSQNLECNFVPDQKLQNEVSIPR
jgi:hypothetical protein